MIRRILNIASSNVLTVLAPSDAHTASGADASPSSTRLNTATVVERMVGRIVARGRGGMFENWSVRVEGQASSSARLERTNTLSLFARPFVQILLSVVSILTILSTQNPANGQATPIEPAGADHYRRAPIAGVDNNPSVRDAWMRFRLELELGEKTVFGDVKVQFIIHEVLGQLLHESVNQASNFRCNIAVTNAIFPDLEVIIQDSSDTSEREGHGLRCAQHIQKILTHSTFSEVDVGAAINRSIRKREADERRNANNSTLIMSFFRSVIQSNYAPSSMFSEIISIRSEVARTLSPAMFSEWYANLQGANAARCCKDDVLESLSDVTRQRKWHPLLGARYKSVSERIKFDVAPDFNKYFSVYANKSIGAWRPIGIALLDDSTRNDAANNAMQQFAKMICDHSVPVSDNHQIAGSSAVSIRCTTSSYFARHTWTLIYINIVDNAYNSVCSTVKMQFMAKCRECSVETINAAGASIHCF